ncbi:KH domain-containing, RNA-binding, signal transduction-associated protein 2 isoform X2 [Aethina tumida]|uniref:KH domain-containing, RNA-binding, signal transduction-associated protein 2 isoform X2 n=1 Tax=Aethina tumida TaxID=116153 RepID=UPI002147A301|nr:KH domain-containing, RNA-binding, signal transduction-associated protein 2 isoform X2 [Aethina tumida]
MRQPEMTDKYDSNGDYAAYGDNFKRKSNAAEKIEIEDVDNEEANPQSQKSGEYVRELLAEKISIDQNKFPNATKLIDQEISKTQQLGKPQPKDQKYVDIYREKPIKVTVKVLVPVREHPKFNFVGKLLGPKGNSMKRLQEETMCKMAVLGRGSMKDRQKEEELRNSLDPKYGHLSDDLHVEISALGPPAEAHARVAFALAEVRKYLIPDNNDNIRQEQMREMEIITSSEPPPAVPEERISSRRLANSASILRSPVARPPLTMRTATRTPVSTPRVMPAKTKIMSILDRARIAMEESYGYDDEPYDPAPASYDPAPPYGSTLGGGSSSGTNHSRSYSSYHHHHEPDYEPTDYYRESASSYGDLHQKRRNIDVFPGVPAKRIGLVKPRRQISNVDYSLGRVYIKFPNN